LHTLLRPGEHQFLERLSALAVANPFLPERIARERELLRTDFEETNTVWSKQVRLQRENPNLQKIAEKAEPIARRLRARLAEGAEPTEDEAERYADLVLYLLYYRFEEHFAAAMSKPGVSFYEAFETEASHFLSLPALAGRFEGVLPHWFAFLFQIRRASHHIFEFLVGSALPAARLRGAAWQSIFTHDLRRYRRVLFDKMRDVATLVTGPSGTGKELVARAIGRSGYIPFDLTRKRFAIDLGSAFFPLNLSALAPTLIESELFGHRKGAFTGALSDREGWLSVCPTLGTVFLDEIGELDSTIQVKLLRVLQSREFQPLGDTKPERFEGKIVAATHRDLAKEMTSGSFREDLYYRLCSDQVSTPSLSEQLADQPDDLNELVLFITRRVVGTDEAEGVTAEVLSWIAENLPEAYAWPGNVRELEQCVRNIVIRREYHPAQPDESSRELDSDTTVDLATSTETADELIERYCTVVYERTGSYLEAARRLQLDRRTVKSKIEAFRKRGQESPPSPKRTARRTTRPSRR
jgi:transcriptional regulator with AAA-type ATPase domain